MKKTSILKLLDLVEKEKLKAQIWYLENKHPENFGEWVKKDEYWQELWNEIYTELYEN